VAKLPVFNGKTGRVEEFIMICRLYLKMRMKGVTVEE